MHNRFNLNEEEKKHIRTLHGIKSITEEVEGDDMIQEWVDTWNAFIFDRLDGGYGGPNNIQSELDYELRNLCPEVIEALQASYDIIGDVDNNIINQVVPKLEKWKDDGGDMTTLERPEINLEKDCPKYKS